MRNLKNLVRQVTLKLRGLHLQIATAESCTGGLVAGLLTEFSGSSNWFDRGFVTYSNLAKEEMLGIKSELIQRYGAVSEEIAAAMAQGALNFSVADLALAITGIAGPNGGTSEKPVGTICFAWAMRDVKTETLRCYFTETNRSKVRQLACIRALEGILIFLNTAAEKEK